MIERNSPPNISTRRRGSPSRVTAVGAPSSGKPPCLSPASMARSQWGLHAFNSDPLGQSPSTLDTLSRSRCFANGLFVRRMVSATSDTMLGSLHARRHDTMHMCALSDTSLGPESCDTSTGHARLATQGENARIDSPVHLLHMDATARHASACTPGWGSDRAFARDAEHPWKRRTTVAWSRTRPDGPGASSVAASSFTLPSFSSSFSGGSTPGAPSPSGGGVGGSSRAGGGGGSSAVLSQRKPSIRSSWSRASAIRVGRGRWVSGPG